MLQALILAAALSPAAPLPCRVVCGESAELDTGRFPWMLWVYTAPRESTGYEVRAGLVLTVEGRRADLGELPGLFNRCGPGVRGSGPVWPRAKACRAWVRGGRLEMLELTLR